MSRIQLIVDSEYFLRESPHPHLFVQLLRTRIRGTFGWSRCSTFFFGIIFC
ncbi:unnamed protein product [Meloidogyne enterolobii]|uniref:Uncharacterized protein n=1 Tax=Meloidogyne enterolobii TaxID=390850 RepID=A0ACB0ZTD4_MELEN